VISRIRTPVSAPGAFYVHDQVSEDYCKQLTSEARIVVQGKPRWVRRSRANHALDCEALCAAIGYALNVQRIPEGVSRAYDEDREPREQDGDALPLPPLLAPSPAGGGGGSFRSRFAGIGQRLNR